MALPCLVGGGSRGCGQTDRMALQRLRREPPRFRPVVLKSAAGVSPHLLRVTLAGDDLAGFAIDQPAASVRLLLPRPGETALTMPTWNGNEFLHADGERPTIRTYTPRRFDPETLELDLDVVLHDGGAVPAWALAASAGAPVAISGPGRGYDIDGSATTFLLAGDESAIPAISQLLEHLSPNVEVTVHLEITHPDARHDLPSHPTATVEWHDLARGPGRAARCSMRLSAPRSPTTPRCGLRARRRPCSASVVTCSISERWCARMRWSAATGRWGGAATTRRGE